MLSIFLLKLENQLLYKYKNISDMSNVNLYLLLRKLLFISIFYFNDILFFIILNLFSIFNFFF